jgi:hypothetical protein
MNEYAEISAALPGRPRWQLVAFAAGCAERIAPMAASLGGSSMAQAAQAGPALAWSTAEEQVQPQTEHVVADLLRLIDLASVDEGRPEVLAGFALNVTVFALEAASGPTPTDRAQAACSGGLDLAAQVDFILAHSPLEAATVMEPDEQEPPGPLQTQEMQAQWASIRLLDVGDRPDAQAVAAVRRLSKARAGELARVMPEFVHRERQEPP